MKEMFQNPILDDLFDVRSDGLTSLTLQKNNINSSQEISKLKNIIENSIAETNIKNQIFESIEKMDNLTNEETCLLNKSFYKMGFVDGISITKEVLKSLDKL